MAKPPKKGAWKLKKDYYKFEYESFCDICEADNQRCFEYDGIDYIIINRLGKWAIFPLDGYWEKKHPKPAFGPCDSMNELLELKCLDGLSFKDRYDELATFDDEYEFSPY